MRAIQMTEFGGPEVLRLADLPVPVPEPGEVLIRVTRAGMNYADTHQRTNNYIAKATLPLVPGSEVAGVREDTGERVVAMCGTGGYAEYATAPGALTFPIADAVDDGTAVAMLVQGITAWHIYKTSARIQRGESVVVHAAAGGVGSLAVQLGKPMGAGRVIAVASSEDKRALAVELGADVAIDAEPEGMAERILEANLGERVDVVLEMVGGQVFEESMKALAPFGRCVAYGIASDQGNDLRTGRLMSRSHTVAGFWLMHCVDRPHMIDEALTGLFELVAEGRLRVVVGATYPLAEAAQAQIDMRARKTSGKVLLDPSA